MIAAALIDMRFWFRAAYWIYAAALVLVVAVDLRGIIGMGAQRWIDLGFMQLQPSEIMKMALVLALARYFHGLRAGEYRPAPLSLIVPALMVVVPAALVLKQPDLGTAMMLLAAGGVLFFLAGVRLWMFAAALAAAVGGGAAGLVDAARLPEEPALYLSRSRARSARRRVSHPAIEDRARLGRPVRQGLPARDAEPPELPAGKADRLHLHDDRRGVGPGRRAGRCLRSISCRARLCLRDRAAQPQPVRPSARRLASRSISFCMRLSIRRWSWG